MAEYMKATSAGLVPMTEAEISEYLSAVPSVVPPKSVSMRQARLQLLAVGVYDQVNAAINSMPQAAQIEWEYAAEVQRDNPLVYGIKMLLDWSEEQLDTYFIEAAKL